MKTPEIVEKDVEDYKQNRKKMYLEEQAEKGTIIMKDNLSDILNHQNNQLLDTAHTKQTRY